MYEAAGGYAPTIGIIGAVLGLIQVMKHLENIEEVGRGIAVAFVATVYGVAVANLFFLPAANKLKAADPEDVQAQGADARRRLQHRGGYESEADSREAGSVPAASRRQRKPRTRPRQPAPQQPAAARG